MNLDNYCPVQASINRYCAAWDEDEAFELAVDKRKDDMMNHLTPEHIQEALSELPDSADLWKNIALVAKDFNASNRIDLRSADDVLRGLFNAADIYTEKEALRQIREERDNPQAPPEDNGDDH